jgi:uncharacterized protein
MLLPYFIACFFFLFIEFYAYQAIKTYFKSKKILLAYKIINAVLFIIIFYYLSKFDRRVGATRLNMYTIGLLFLDYLPKIILTLVLFAEDIVRVLVGNYNLVFKNKTEKFLPSRRKFVSLIGLGLAAIPFSSLLYGITVGRYNYKVICQKLFFPDLPDAFDGFTITHISDVHSGSFDNPEKINYAIDLINEQNTDLILFTGDIVNNKADEMHPWIDTFNRIQPHKYGKFAVLGNHDYGEYLDWQGNDKAKGENFEAIKSLYGQIGFDLLLNEHKFIQKDNDKLAIVGVENWGVKFKQAGDLVKASKGLTKDDFKILMSHDPSHWDVEVQNNPKHFQLTLSGHTHGLQFGIEIPGYFKWSPVQFVYKHWAGLYNNAERFLYVNRGFGYHAFPGRVGIMPEITVFTLKKGKNIA